MWQGRRVPERQFHTKKDIVAEAIREAVRSGELRPGAWVRSEEWAERLGTSLTPVREALQKLEAEGVLRNFPHRGARVARITRAEFEEVYQLRSAVEGLAAYRAGQRLDDRSAVELADRLEEIQTRMNRAVAANDMKLIQEISREFHFAIYEKSESPRLLRLIDSLWVTFPWGPLSVVPSRRGDTVYEHASVIDAIRHRDPEAIREAIASHIDSGVRAILDRGADLGFELFDEE